MAYSNDRFQKPRGQGAGGREDGNRPRGENPRGQGGQRPGAGKSGFGKRGDGKPGDGRPGDGRPERKPWHLEKQEAKGSGERWYDGRNGAPKRPARSFSPDERPDGRGERGAGFKPRRFDGPKPEGRRFDGPKPEGRFGGPKPEGRRFDGPKPAQPVHRAPGGEGPRFKPAPRVVRPVPVVEPIEQPFDGDEPMPRENLLVGRNPIREAVKSGRDIEKLLVAKGELSGSAREIVAQARERGIVVQVVDRTRLSAIAPNHQGMIAFASAYKYATVEDMLARAKENGEEPLLVILDGVTDPHNLGAIIRSAECAGAHGVIVPERRAVGLTPAAVKASAGAVEHLPVARVGNLSRLLETLKGEGVWIAAADMAGEPYTAAPLTGPLAIVIGAEGEGVSRLLLERSDRRVALPVRGKIESLNASVAAGVLLYEVRRQRG